MDTNFSKQLVKSQQKMGKIYNKQWGKIYNKQWAKILTSNAKISASVQQIFHQVVKILTTCHLNVFSPTFISISTGLTWIYLTLTRLCDCLKF